MNDKPERTVSIFVNLDEHNVDKGKISYEQIVALCLKDADAASNGYPHKILARALYPVELRGLCPVKEIRATPF